MKDRFRWAHVRGHDELDQLPAQLGFVRFSIRCSQANDSMV